jgi:hypothetical protein
VRMSNTEDALAFSGAKPTCLPSADPITVHRRRRLARKDHGKLRDTYDSLKISHLNNYQATYSDDIHKHLTVGPTTPQARSVC